MKTFFSFCNERYLFADIYNKEANRINHTEKGDVL